MGNPPRPRTRKRVQAIRRAPDGSAFQKCDSCGFMVAIALADMHECEDDTKKDVKRFKGLVSGMQNVVKQTFGDQPRSAFRFFMDDFKKTCKDRKMMDIDRKGFETWRNMSKEERKPYTAKAQVVNSAYLESLNKEIDDQYEVDDEADSAMVGKFDQLCEVYGYFEDSDSYPSEVFESLNTWEWEMVKSWVVERSS